jgi:ABC-type phosphate transport system substrate-binding protein
MSGHHPRRGAPRRHPAHPAIWAVAAAIIIFAVGACSSSAATSTSASAVAVASIGPGGRAPTLTGAGSTFDAPFFSVAFVKYQQQHPGVTIGYSAVGSSAGIAALSAQQVDFGASDVPMTTAEQAAAKGGPITQVPVDLGGEGIAYNLSLPAGARLHLTGPVLAEIFLGQSAQTVTADAAQKPTITPTDFSIVNEPGAASYPISGYSWALVYTRQASQATGQALVAMLDWLTHDGQAYAAANGYVPLPAQIQQLARTMLQQVAGPTGTPLLS